MITDADYNTLLDLVISDLNTNDSKWKHSNFVTVRNPLRTALNYEHAQQQAKAAGVPLIVAVAEDVRKLRGQGSASLEARRRKRILQLADNKTDNLPGLLPLYPGQFLMLRDNKAVEVGLANGSVGILEAIILDTTDPLPSTLEPGSMFFTKKLPVCLLVRFKNFHLSKTSRHIPRHLKEPLASSFAALGDLEEGVIPILPKQASFSWTVDHDTNTKWKIRRRQFPVTPAACITAHAAQGMTLGPTIVDLNGADVITNGPYVILSRVTTMQDLRFVRPFPISVLQKGLDSEYVADMKRLREIESRFAAPFFPQILGLEAHMKSQDAKRREQERHISAQAAQSDSDAGHTLSNLLFSLSCADDDDYPNRLPGFRKRRSGMLSQDDSADDTFPNRLNCPSAFGSVLTQDSDTDDDAFANRLPFASSAGRVLIADSADDDFPNLLSTLPDPTDTFPNRLSKLCMSVCPDCGSTAGTGNCKCDKT